MLKKVLAITLAVLLLAGALSVTVFADEESPVTEIRTVEDLYMINLDLAGNYKLMNDIDLTEATAEGGDWDYNGRGWEPIGSDGIYSGETPFTGTFDGNGFEIKGLRINVSSKPSGTGRAYVGLFASNEGTIKDFTVSGDVSASDSTSYIGVITGRNNGTIANVSFSGTVTVSAAVSDVGAITGYNIGTIKNAAVSGAITVSAWVSDVGAITGYNNGTIENCTNNSTVSVSHSRPVSDSLSNMYVGGITGNAGADSLIIKCDNNNEVYCSGGFRVVYTGGIAGYTDSNVAVSECFNSGKITAESKGYYSSYYAKAYSSGITYGGSVNDCYNTGTITASGYSSTYSSTTYSYSSGISASSNGIISNSYNTGIAKKAISYNKVTNCYFLSGSGADTTGAKALTAAQMKLKAMYRGFDFDNTWFIDSAGEYPYPQLINNAAYPPEQPTEPETEAPTEPETDAPTEAETSEPTVAPKVYYLGDVDGDGDATVVDATYIQRYATRVNVPYPVGELIPMD
jgi:hypothetical protein